MIKNTLITGAILVGGYQLVGPNTTLDRFMARNVWCEPCESVGDQVKNIKKLSDKQKLDWHFKGMRPGDRLRYGDIELEAMDSRAQTSRRVPNKNNTDPDGRIRLGCPGYIVLNVYHEGELIGEEIEMAYAAKVLGSGGLFDGWPDFSLESVLRKTDLDSKEQEAVLFDAEWKQGEENQKNREARERRIFETYLGENPEIGESMERCSRLFEREDEQVRYVVRRGDNAVQISRLFNECSDDSGFFPSRFGVDTAFGSDLCVEPWTHNSQRGMNCAEGGTHLTPGDTVYLYPSTIEGKFEVRNDEVWYRNLDLSR